MRQAVFDGFPEGLPDLTPLGVKLSLEVILLIHQHLHSYCQCPRHLHRDQSIISASSVTAIHIITLIIFE